jgi:P27 family predicted phage terminase small subunit
MSRIRKPLAKHLLQGTQPGYAPATEEVDVPVSAGRPTMPKHLTPLAAERWKEMVRILRRKKTLAKEDGPMLEQYCEAWARWRKDTTQLAAEGSMITITVLDSNGEAHEKRIQNPLCKSVTALDNSLRASLKEFGLTSVTRTRTKQTTTAPTKKSQLEVEPESSYGVYLRCKAQGSAATPPAGFVAGMHLPAGFVETEVAQPTRKVPAAVAAAQEKAGAFDDIDLDAISKELLGR